MAKTTTIVVFDCSFEVSGTDDPGRKSFRAFAVFTHLVCGTREPVSIES